VVQQYPAARFIIAGTGSQDAFLKNLVHALHMDGQVEFVGAVPQQGIVQLMQNALVFVSPSLDDGTSIALLEAMGAGLVPVVSDIVANRPWVRDGKDGYLFKTGDIYTLAQAIIKVLEGRIQPSILAEKRNYVKQRVAWSTIAQQYLSLYQQVVDRKGRR
jgi:glycosyltransferase involved in cell wall biosynthesis